MENIKATAKPLKSRYASERRRRLAFAQDMRMFQDTEETPEGHLMKQAIKKALSMLTPKQKHYMTLYFVEGLNMTQIGEKEGVDKSTVSRTLLRAKKNLFTYMQFTSVRFLNDRELADKFNVVVK